MNDEYKVHLFSIRDNALDVYTYPILCTMSDLRKFLSVRLEVVTDESVPEFFKYPDQYSVVDCGTYEPVLPDGSMCPYCVSSCPRVLGLVSDFKGGFSDGKGTSTNKDI